MADLELDCYKIIELYQYLQRQCKICICRNYSPNGAFLLSWNPFANMDVPQHTVNPGTFATVKCLAPSIGQLCSPRASKHR